MFDLNVSNVTICFFYILLFISFCGIRQDSFVSIVIFLQFLVLCIIWVPIYIVGIKNGACIIIYILIIAIHIIIFKPIVKQILNKTVIIQRTILDTLLKIVHVFVHHFVNVFFLGILTFLFQTAFPAQSFQTFSEHFAFLCA